MRRLLKWTFVMLVFLAIVGVTVALSVHYAAPVSGMTITIDGEKLAGPAVAALFGGAATLGVLAASLLVVVVLASIAIVVPVVLLFVLAAVVGAVFVGLSPILIPVLLLVGLAMLLSRRNRRRAGAATAMT